MVMTYYDMLDLKYLTLGLTVARRQSKPESHERQTTFSLKRAHDVTKAFFRTVTFFMIFVRNYRNITL